jgi:hypothetical protein
MNNSQRQLNALQRQRQQFQTWEDSILDYSVNWAACFPGDPILESEWSVLYGAADISPQTTVGNTTKARIQVNIGQAVIVNSIYTAAGQRDSRALLILSSSKNDEISTAGSVTFGGDYATHGGGLTIW